MRINQSARSTQGICHEKHYDLSKSRPNPYGRKAKRQLTIRLDEATIQHFKDLAGSTGVPCQNRINLYPRDCAAEKKRLKMEWPT